VRIGLISTINTNIGDDMIRIGIINVLNDVFKRQKLDFVTINKHHPYTVYPEWHPIRWAPRGKRILSTLLHRYGFSCFDDCDLIIQCGAPVLWPNCHRSEWATPLWHQVVGRLSGRIPVLNLAAGSCYPWERQPEYISESRDALYLKAILGYCRLTTVRDRLAQRLCVNLGAQTPLIPCSAFVSFTGQVTSKRNDGIVVINYMSGGGHYEWEQNIEKAAWHKTAVKLLNLLRKRHKLVFLCHNKVEYDLAENLSPDIRRFLPNNVVEYFEFISGAKAAVCNRMHASVALAGMGIPSVAVCTDTRLLMVEALGLPCFYVKDVTAEMIEDKIESLLAKQSDERERLLALRSETWKEYFEAVSSITR